MIPPHPAADSARNRASRWLTTALGALALTLLSMLPSTAAAHLIGQSYLYLQIKENDLTGRFEIALEDLNPALGLSGTAREITPENVRDHLAFLRDYVARNIVISSGGSPLNITFLETDLPVAAGYVRLPVDISGYDAVPEQLTFDYGILFDEDPTHQGFVLIESNWATGTFANEAGISLVFLPEGRNDTLDLTTTGRWTGFLAVLRLGMEAFWEGLDHVLFLIALLIPSVMKREDRQWQPVESFDAALGNGIRILVTFAVAWGLALVLAVTGVVTLPDRAWEIGIAVSVVIAALNVLVPLLQGKVWLVVLGLGLFHGVGFAEAMIKQGVTEEFMGLSLVAFALGLVLSQLILAGILIPALFLFRRFRLFSRLFMPAGALFILGVGLAWLAERTLDIDLPIRELPVVIVEAVTS